MDPVTLPLTIPALRVFGAPMIVKAPNAPPGVYVFAGEALCGWIYAASNAIPGHIGIFPPEWCHLDLTHPEGERIAQLVATGPCPDADRETLAAIRDVVLAMVPA